MGEGMMATRVRRAVGEDVGQSGSQSKAARVILRTDARLCFMKIILEVGW